MDSNEINKNFPIQFRKSLPHSAPVILTLLLLLTLGLILSVSQSAQENRTRAYSAGDCTVPATDLPIDSEEQKMADLINAYRTQNKLPTLTLAPSLTKTAAWTSNDMNARKVLSHVDSLNRALQTRLTDCGISLLGTFSENISSMGSTADPVFAAWQVSAVHNANMLSANFRTIGIARAGNYWTTEFSSNTNPEASPSASISSNPNLTQLSITPQIATASPSIASTSPSVIVSAPPGGVPSPACLGPGCPTVPPEATIPVTASTQPVQPIATTQQTTGSTTNSSMQQLIDVLLNNMVNNHPPKKKHIKPREGLFMLLMHLLMALFAMLFGGLKI